MPPTPDGRTTWYTFVRGLLAGTVLVLAGLTVLQWRHRAEPVGGPVEAPPPNGNAPEVPAEPAAADD